MSVSTSPQVDVDTIWYTRCPVPTASGVAIDTGLLSEEFAVDGIDVASIRASGDAAVRESHFTHSLAALFREGGNVPALAARSRGEATTLVGLTWVEEFQALVTLPGSGVRTPADLAGRTVLLPGHGAERVDFSRAMALRGLAATLDIGGLSESDVVTADVVTPLGDLRERGATYESDAFLHEVAALRRGDGDAVYVKGAPAADIVRREGLHVITDLANATDLRHRINNGTPRTITVSTALLAARPDLVVRYLAVLLRAADWSSRNALQTHQILAAETGASLEAVSTAYGADAHTRLRPRLDDELVAALGNQKDFLLRHGFLAGDVDIDAWLDPAPLAAAQELVSTTPDRTNEG